MASAVARRASSCSAEPVEGLGEQRVQGAARCPGLPSAEPVEGRLGVALREQILHLAGRDPFPVLLVGARRDLVGGAAAEPGGQQARGSRRHVLLRPDQEPFDARQPPFLHRARVLVEPQPVVDLLSPRLQAVACGVVLDRAPFDLAHHGGTVAARQPQHDGADIAAVAHGVRAGRPRPGPGG